MGVSAELSERIGQAAKKLVKGLFIAWQCSSEKVNCAFGAMNWEGKPSMMELGPPAQASNKEDVGNPVEGLVAQ